MTNANTSRPLYECIQGITEELGSIPATGKNPFGDKAVSIGDVEEAIRPLLTKAGVLTFWSYVSLQPLDKGLWMAHLRVRLQNAHDEKDIHEDEWIDIGNSPMAAVSFARKGYYKALFHIAEPGDDALPSTAGRRGQTTTAVNGQEPGGDEPEAVRLFDALKEDHDQQRWAIVKRFGWTKAKGGAVSKWLRSLADDRQAAIVIAFKQLTMDETGPPLGASSEPRDEGAEGRDRAGQRYGVHQSAVQRRAESPPDETRDELMRVINAMPMNRRANFLSEHGYKGQALKTWLAALDDMKAGELLATARVPEQVAT